MPASDRSHLACRHAAAGDDFTNPNIPPHYPPDLELEPQHLDIDLFVDAAGMTASGTVTTTVRARHAGPTVLKLDAIEFLDVDVRDADGRPIAWRYDGHKIVANWREPFAAGEERRLAVTYRVVEPADGLLFSRPDDAYPDQPLYAATDHETERARHWLPSIDLPSVRTTLDFHLRAAEHLTILANGLLIKETAHDDGTKTAHWRLEQLCPSYLVCFAIADFVRADDGVFDDGEKQIELAYFCSQQHDEASLRRSFGRTRPMMAWMTRRLGLPFPFPKYYQFALPGIGGAMENISLVSWTDWAIMDEEMAREATWWVDNVNVHEMAHSYFGDAVVIRDFAHAWLKESWATYMEQCWREDNDGEDEALYVFYDHAQSYFAEADERYQRPIVSRRFKSSWQMYDRHLYPGGACRLHTLRRDLGDELFWPAVHDYLDRYNGQVVETDDFRRVMEEHSGRSLGKFFDQWFFSPGYPKIKVTYDYDEKQKLATFEVEQTQVAVDKGIPAFELSTDLGWTLDGEEHRRPIKLTQARHVFTIPLDSEPEMVRFDPDAKILHKLEFNPGDPLLRRQLTEAPDVIGRMVAAHELAKTGKRANIQAIVDAYASEPFWGVREQFARALAEANTDAAVAGLAEVVAAEQDPLVMELLFGHAAGYRDARLRDALAGRLRDELPPLAKGAAYRAMGAQRRLADWDLLVQGSQETGHNGIAQSGAFRGLAATRSDEAVERLMAAAPYGRHSNRVRPAIAGALADIGQGLDRAAREQAREALEDLLRDPWPNVRRAAAYGLVDMKAPEGIPALEAYGRTLSHGDRVRMEQAIGRLRDEDKSDGSAVKKQVEDLNEKVRKLEEQLQKLESRVAPEGQEE